MSTKTRARVYPRRAPWDVRPSAERSLVAAADQWVREHAIDGEGIDLVIGGATWMPREILRPEWAHALSADEVAAADQTTLVRTVDGYTFTAEGYETRQATPSFDYVTQGATTAHRDRRAFARPQTRIIRRRACVRPCLASARNPRHRCIDTGRTYVRRLTADGPAGHERLTIARDGRRMTGRTLSPHQGRLARWTAEGYWPDHVAAVEPSSMVDRTGWEAAVLAPGEAPVYVPTASYCDVPWQRAELVRPKANRGRGKGKTGAPRKADPARTTAADRLRVAAERDPAAMAWTAALLRGIELAHQTGRRSTIGQGWTATYDPTAPREQRVSIERTLPATPDEPVEPCASASFVGSWAARTTLARTVALETLTQ